MATKISQGYTPLQKSDFTIVNQQDREVTDGYGCINIWLPASSRTKYSILFVKSIPTTPYSMTVHLKMLSGLRSAVDYGILCRGASSAYRQIRFHSKYTQSTAGSYNLYNGAPLLLSNYDEQTLLSDIYTNYAKDYTQPLSWFKMTDNGTNLFFYNSTDGVNWKYQYTISRTYNSMTPTTIGFFAFNTSESSVGYCVSCDHFNIDYTG